LPTLAGLGLVLGLSAGTSAAADKFRVEEATIQDIQNAIKNGQTTCRGIVQAYLDRARAFNGVCTELVTKDGASVPATAGAVRAGSPMSFPTVTRAVSSFLPNLDQYIGLPLDLGRMETTASDTNVKQQFGMVVGRADAGQLNALETLNIRGERSVTCKAVCDTPPSRGPLPASCPSACEAFRRQPDALERAAELDAKYGRRPDLVELPLYCAVASVKDWYDVKDMRSTGGNDVNYALDAAPRDSTVVAALRAKGAIIHAVSIAAEIGLRADGSVRPTRSFVGGSGSIRSTWGGHVCNPYDTERSAGPSSGGAGVSVSANLVTFGICETTGGSCREPANQNAITSLVTTKGLLSEDNTATAQFINHRPGILARTLADAARVLDAIRMPGHGYFDSRDVFTAIPKGFVSKEPYASFIVSGKQRKGKQRALEGIRIGIVREYMVKHTPNDVAISDSVDAEIKAVLRDQLGAELVESVDPLYPDDPGVPNMKYTFRDALAETLPFMAPEYLLQTRDGALEFAVPGHDVKSLNYMVRLALRQVPLSDGVNMRRILSGFEDADVSAFSMAKYLIDRGDARITDWAGYAANSKWRSDSQEAGARNAASPAREVINVTPGIDRVKMQSVFRLAVLKVMHENQIDVFVHPSVGVPQWKIGIDREPTIDGRAAAGPSITDLLGVPEVTVPAGFNQVVYDPRYVLSADKKSYFLVPGTVRSMLSHAMPFNVNFWAGPGDEPMVLKIASAYESVTKHRVPPPAFGPLPARSAPQHPSTRGSSYPAGGSVRSRGGH
jgi:Asp-tRNA(Asn)/Glu-tRNA(Gln) amidotransferase A subunit family amidase